MDFYKDIQTILQMKELKSVAWKLTGENPAFECERVQVRFEDVEGTVYEMVIHSPKDSLSEKCRNEEEVILNIAFSHFGINTSGDWIGITTDIETMVNRCREKAKYEGAFFDNEEKCRWSDYITPIYIM